MAWAVIKDARPEARNAASSATSSLLPSLPSVVRSTSSAFSSGVNQSSMGVSMQPGQMQLTRMPLGPSSLASARVKEITAPLVAE